MARPRKRSENEDMSFDDLASFISENDKIDSMEFIRGYFIESRVVDLNDDPDDLDWWDFYGD